VAVSGARPVSGFGITVGVPGRWDIRLYRRTPLPGEAAHAVLHAATFPLPADRGDFGDGAVDRMGPADVFVALVEFDPASVGTALFAAVGFPAPLRSDDLSRTSLQHQLGRQSGAQRFFHAGGRAWCLYTVIGDDAARGQLVGVANRLIAGIEVSASAGPGSP